MDQEDDVLSHAPPEPYRKPSESLRRQRQDLGRALKGTGPGSKAETEHITLEVLYSTNKMSITRKNVRQQSIARASLELASPAVFNKY